MVCFVYDFQLQFCVTRETQPESSVPNTNGLYIKIWIRNGTNLYSTKFSICISRFRGINQTHFELFIQGNTNSNFKQFASFTHIVSFAPMRNIITNVSSNQPFSIKIEVPTARERERERERMFHINYSKQSGKKTNQTSILCSHSSSDLHELRDRPGSSIHINRNSLLFEFETTRINFMSVCPQVGPGKLREWLQWNSVFRHFDFGLDWFTFKRGTPLEV